MANYDSIKKKTDEQAKVKIEESNKIYDDQYAATEKIYNEQIKQSDASFARTYDRANVQRIVNERYAKEIAANMGLSNSGYNLTQQTQIMLSYGNAVLETDMQKTAAANSIRQQLAGVKADIEAKKSQSAFDIQASYDQQAVDTYNQQVAAEKAAAAARITANANAKNSAYSDLVSFLRDGKYTTAQKVNEMTRYMSQYGMDDFNYFLGIAGITQEQYNGYYSTPVSPKKSNTITPTVSGFKTREGDNFKVSIGNTTYKVENEGAVTNIDTIAALNSAESYGDIKKYNGLMYYKYKGTYYHIGNVEGLFNTKPSKRSGWSDLYAALN